MNQTRKIETQVGAFVLLGLIVLGGFVVALSDVGFEPQRRIYADFGYSGALKVGAPVVLSGVRVGRVSELALLGVETSPPEAEPVSELGRREFPVVRASLDIDDAVADRLGGDAHFYVGMQGLIGESYIELAPGVSQTGLDESRAIRGVDAPKLHVMVLRFSSTLAGLGRLLGSSNDEDLRRVGESLASILESLDALLGDKSESLASVVDDLSIVASTLRRVLFQVDRALGDGGELAGMLRDGAVVAAQLRSRVPDVLQRASSAAQSLEKLSARLEETADPKSVAETLAKVREAAQRLSTVTEDARFLTQSLRRGEGTLGGLLRDPTVYEDVKELLRELKRNPWKLLWRE